MNALVLEPKIQEESEGGVGTMVVVNLVIGYVIHTFYFIYRKRQRADTYSLA